MRVKPENCIEINCSEIPSVDVRNLCHSFFGAIMRSTEDKEFQSKFEQYKKDAEKTKNTKNEI